MIKRAIIFSLLFPIAAACTDSMLDAAENPGGKNKLLPTATVVTGSGKVSFRDSSIWTGPVKIDFAPCMANELFTFSEVWVGNKLVNKTSSDNIGPFGLNGGGWCGGNHTNKDSEGREVKSARTDSVRVFADGRLLDINRPDSLRCQNLVIEVVNSIYMPADTVTRLCTERIRYLVSGNSIEVNATHVFECPKPVDVNRYYGMQSMMIGEKEILTPGGAYREWTPIDSVSSFTKGEAPDFCLFVEHSPDAYQACWLDPAVDLGDRHMVNSSDVVFIGNSWSKSYHKTIGSKILKAGDTTSWHGIYSWFKKPLGAGDPYFSHVGMDKEGVPGVIYSGKEGFAYGAYMGGQPVIIYAYKDGKTTINPIIR